MNETVSWYGARVERGIIKAQEGDKFRVESYDRKGVTTLPIKVVRYMPEDEVFKVGDLVYFFVCEDGKGYIIERFEG